MKLFTGYVTGVFDLFHVGHLNILRNASSLCDKLIVGVTTDELALCKNKVPIIPFSERIEIVRSIQFVDAVLPKCDMDKKTMCAKIKVNVMFVGDDWHNTNKWNLIEKDLASINVEVIYLPYTTSTSSTIIRKNLQSQS